MEDSIGGAAICRGDFITGRLTYFYADNTRTRAMCGIIRAAFRRDRRIFANITFRAYYFFMMIARLALRRAMSATGFLLFARLRAVIERAQFAHAILTEDLFGFALNVSHTGTELGRWINTLAATRLRLEARVSYRFLSPAGLRGRTLCTAFFQQAAAIVESQDRVDGVDSTRADNIRDAGDEFTT